MANILLTTLGTTWQIVPELIGFTNPETVDLYRNHPESKHLRALKSQWDIPAVNAIWIITTMDDRVRASLEHLKRWHRLLNGYNELELRLFRVADLQDLNSEQDCRTMREAILKVSLLAAKTANTGKLLLSLAGGRKTMSSDMQLAASYWGCHALLHVIDHADPAGHLKNATAEDFTRPFPAEWFDSSHLATPIIIGSHNGSSLLQREIDKLSSHMLQDISSFIASPEVTHEILIDSFLLSSTIEERLKQAEYLTVNYTHELMATDQGTNFFALYHLPPEKIDLLKQHRIGLNPKQEAEEIAWLRGLPKTDLHCHLGGVLSAPELIRVAAACRKEIEPYRDLLAPWLAFWKSRLNQEAFERSCGEIAFKKLSEAIPTVPEPWAVCSWILLFETDPERLDRLIFQRYIHENRFLGIGFPNYERLGDLQGSSLLQHPIPIQETCRCLLEKARANHVHYLEIRCSPTKYDRGGFTPQQIATCIAQSLAGSDITASLIFTASRHGSIDEMSQMVEVTRSLLREQQGFPMLKGFDLAGNEFACNPSRLRNLFLPLMERCLRITIHAGEATPVQNIWEAVYHLNAERIGHGLTLQENPQLASRFLDRNIAIEMCPSSNMQIVGFQDNYLPETHSLPQYPLRQYLSNGLRVTVNTDNPGISRTDFTRELHRAARLTPEGLSLWDVLRLIRNGFKASFVDRETRNLLLRNAERAILDYLMERLVP